MILKGNENDYVFAITIILFLNVRRKKQKGRMKLALFFYNLVVSFASVL